LDGHWIAGFVEADGHFSLGLRKQSDLKFGFRVSPKFSITQHNRDILLLNRIKLVFTFGNIHTHTKDNSRIEVAKRDMLINNIIPFFEIYPMHGDKLLNYLDWCQGMDIISKGEHTTKEGLIKLKKIVENMNNKRKAKK